MKRRFLALSRQVRKLSSRLRMKRRSGKRMTRRRRIRRSRRSSKILGLNSKTWWYLLGAGVLAYLFTPFKQTVNGLLGKKSNQG